MCIAFFLIKNAMEVQELRLGTRRKAQHELRQREIEGHLLQAYSEGCNDFWERTKVQAKLVFIQVNTIKA